MSDPTLRPLVLLADDDVMFAEDTAAMLGARFRVNTVHSGEEVLYSVVNDPPEVLLLDVEFGPCKMTGLTVLEALDVLEEPPPVIMLSGRGDMPTIVQAIKRGAFHYLQKEPDPDELLHLIDICLEENARKRRLRVMTRDAAVRGTEFVAVDPRTVGVLEWVDRIAPTEGTILITGATGVGKEMIAREIHRRSPRKDNLLVAMNCTALPDELIESELFGNVPGAFTGALGREGLIATAKGGTLFLDEIGDAPPSLQQKLLRVLEERKYRPVGADREQTADVRIIAATRRNLAEEVAHGRFREDLLFRLRVLEVAIPDLRDRPLDIEPLVEVMCQRANQVHNRRVLGFSREALNWLADQEWPGNARELRNVVERAVISAEREYCGLGDVLSGAPGRSVAPAPYHDAKKASEQAFQLAYLVDQLERHDGVISRAAEASGLSRQAFSRICDSLGVKAERFRSRGES